MVGESLAGSGLACQSQATSVSGAFTPGGRVTVTVSCVVALGDVTQFGLIPGSRTLTASATEVIDRTRGGDLMAERRLRGCRGNVSLLVVIMVPALLMAAGLVLDGGRQLQARRDAGAAAGAAARAASQLSEQEIYGHGLDPGLATGRANAELAAQGATRFGGRRRPDGRRHRHRRRRLPASSPAAGSVSTSSSATPLERCAHGSAP